MEMQFGCESPSILHILQHATCIVHCTLYTACVVQGSYYSCLTALLQSSLQDITHPDSVTPGHQNITAAVQCITSGLSGTAACT